jgi:hypothetical protein
MERVVRPKQDFIPIECWISAAEWLEFGDASSLRLVSKPFCDVVRRAVFTDDDTIVYNEDKWVTCFPSAIALNLATTALTKPTFSLGRLTHLQKFEISDAFEEDVSPICKTIPLSTMSFKPFHFHSLRLDISDLIEEPLLVDDSFFSSFSGIHTLEL